MTSYAAVIYRCPTCGKPLSRRELQSYNTFGGIKISWSDGVSKSHGFRQEFSGWLVKCPLCLSFFWADKPDKVVYEYEERAFLQVNDPEALKPSFEDYISILATHPLSTEQERYVRNCLRKLWKDRRKCGNQMKEMSPGELDNLASLANLMDETDDNDIFRKAEILSEMGDYDDVLSMLTRIDNPEQEKQARINVWRLWNDRRRYASEEKPLTNSETTNLLLLAKLVDEKTDDDLVTKAEIMRELGCFEEALALLAKMVNLGSPLAKKIRHACQCHRNALIAY